LEGKEKAMNIFKAVATLALVFALGSSAQAAVLITPPLPALQGNYLECYIVNASSSTQTVEVEAVISSGAIAGSSLITLEAGAGSGISLPASAAGYYYRFTVDGASHFYRASIAVLVPDVGLISALPAQ
jgi:hypothetical protein